MPNRFSVTRDGVEQGIDEISGGVSASKFSQVRLIKGDVLHVMQGGGGGYGDPALRDPSLIAADLAEGYITAWPGSPADQGEGLK
jgi:N-methylhydantoinase B/oxoprolinase/acetone carboxylase alpha subunit